MTLYDRIRTRREELGMSQDELAKKLGYKSRSTIAKIESGENDITQSKIVAFAKALGVKPGFLMGWDEVPAPTIKLTQQEEAHIKKYRQLSDARRYVVDEVLDAQYQKQMEEQSAEKEEQRLG